MKFFNFFRRKKKDDVILKRVEDMTPGEISQIRLNAVRAAKAREKKKK